MLKSKEGQKIPKISFRSRHNGEWLDLSTDEIFSQKKVVVFALPGAYTPTCSSSHLPRYEELATTFKKNGVDDIFCLSVNDGFVMEAWGKDQNLESVRLLPDGNGDFSQWIGMLVDKSDLGFGKRSWRYSMLVNDGVIEKMFIEADLPGDPYEVSDADTMLKHLAPEASLPVETTIFSKPGCPYCAQAKGLLKEHGYQFEEIELKAGVSYKTLRNLTGENTAPQIYIGGRHIKGYDELKLFLKQ